MSAGFPFWRGDSAVLINVLWDRDARWTTWRERDTDADWTENWWFANADAIRETDFNLSANRHRPQSRVKVEHRDPLEILEELREIDELTEAIRGAVAN